ncbi:MAG: YncE family protein [Bacteroidales bacterium]
MKTRQLLIIASFALLTSCSIFDDGSGDPVKSVIPSGRGVFVINEGNFTHGNGSLSYYSIDSSKIYNDLFSQVNGRPLGDVPSSMAIKDGYAYIVVNNSGKIEVVDALTLKSKTTISGLNSPRNILFVNSSKAYVTSMWGTSVYIIDLITQTLKSEIAVRRSTEAIVVSGNRVFVSNFISGNSVMVLDKTTDRVIDSLEVGDEPESMVIDKNNKLWVLCSGGYSDTNVPQLLRIDPATLAIEKRDTFPSGIPGPSALRINSGGDTLYFLRNGVWRHPVDETNLPENPFIRQGSRTLYNIAVDPLNGHIFASDAGNFTDRGYLLWFGRDGQVSDSAKADIIPGSLFFRQGTY